RLRAYPTLPSIGLDAARRRGSNIRAIRLLCGEATQRHGFHVRVGGGVRTVARAAQLLKAGADQVIVGTAAIRNGKVNHAFLRRLRASGGKKKVVVALDCDRGPV